MIRGVEGTQYLEIFSSVPFCELSLIAVSVVLLWYFL